MFRYLNCRTLHYISVTAATVGLAVQTILEVVFVGASFLCVPGFNVLDLSFVAT